MKPVKVTITKEIVNGRYNYIYPDGYDSKKITMEGYEHQSDPAKHGQTEFCLGMAADDFPENANIVVLSQEEYDSALATIKTVP